MSAGSPAPSARKGRLKSDGLIPDDLNEMRGPQRAEPFGASTMRSTIWTNGRSWRSIWPPGSERRESGAKRPEGARERKYKGSGAGGAGREGEL